ncbi:MAG TPA: ATP-binding protein [Bacteroidales bacterium]|jgi:signal transduction histidine kinase|nr:ATP-binding protein [Bacteroidales bacterium]HRS18202.1 ATP-binding protein [Bacteroidales bacterium]
MKLYSAKYKIKVALFTIAILFVGAIIYLLNTTITNIKQEERKQVLLWAEAVQKRYTLVDYTNKLFEKLQEEERRKVELWSDAQHHLLYEDDSQFLTFLLKIISSNKNIPIILTDAKGNVVSSVNTDFAIPLNKPMPDSIKQIFTEYNPIPILYDNEPINYLYYTDSKLFSELQNVMNNMIQSFIEEVVKNAASVPVIITNKDTTQIIAYGNIQKYRIETNEKIFQTIQEMASSNPPIPIILNNSVVHYIFYEDSTLITRLRYYPTILIGIGFIVLLFAYFALRSSEKFEQNQLMVGMSKETAHQLGTPISSLMAWVELLKQQNIDNDIVTEINKDVTRLQTIAERFSKIGSAPNLNPHVLYDTIQKSLDYIQIRTSQTISFHLHCQQKNIVVPLNIALFEWVIENICKNAIDAMQGKGSLSITIISQSPWVHIDIEDSGKGIPRNKFKTIFKPGYTTKQRGWGLGLSLAKRIIEEYHNGKIFVKFSELNKGTTIRISLPMA